MRIYINLILVYLCVLTQHKCLGFLCFKSKKTSGTSKTTSVPLNPNIGQSSTSPTGGPKSASLTSIIPSNDPITNYRNFSLLKDTNQYDETKAQSNTTRKWVLIIRSKDDLFETLIRYEIEILKVLHSKAIRSNWPSDYGLMKLIAHGIYPLKKAGGPAKNYLFLVTELTTATVYDRYLTSDNKIISGRKMFSFRTTCMLGCALLDGLERLNEIGVAHGNLMMDVMKLKLHEGFTGDKINDFVLTDFRWSRIYMNDGKPITESNTAKKTLDPSKERYTSADVIEGKPVTPSTDAWALIYIIIDCIGGNPPSLNSNNSLVQITRTDYLKMKRNPNLNDLPASSDQKRAIKLIQALVAMVKNTKLTVDYKPLRTIFQNAMKDSERNGDTFDWYPNYR